MKAMANGFYIPKSAYIKSRKAVKTGVTIDYWENGMRETINTANVTERGYLTKGVAYIGVLNVEDAGEMYGEPMIKFEPNMDDLLRYTNYKVYSPDHQLERLPSWARPAYIRATYNK